jgi:hypothetical protein
MPEQHLYEYAIIRLIPRVEREEFMNTGVVVFCNRQRFLQCRFVLNPLRLEAFGGIEDIEQVQSYLDSFKQICEGHKDAGPIARLPVAERFRWLTASRSTVIQTSRPHPGLCAEGLENLLQRLFEQFVL